MDRIWLVWTFVIQRACFHAVPLDNSITMTYNKITPQILLADQYVYRLFASRWRVFSFHRCCLICEHFQHILLLFLIFSICSFCLILFLNSFGTVRRRSLLFLEIWNYLECRENQRRKISSWYQCMTLYQNQPVLLGSGKTGYLKLLVNMEFHGSNVLTCSLLNFIRTVWSKSTELRMIMGWRIRVITCGVSCQVSTKGLHLGRM